VGRAPAIGFDKAPETPSEYAGPGRSAMKFILVVIVMLSDSLTEPPSVTAVEFNGEPSCRKAAEDIEATLARMQANVLATARCYPKGDG
jgi:hypothetical protein